LTVVPVRLRLRHFLAATCRGPAHKKVPSVSFDDLKTLLPQQLLPKRLLTQAAGRFARHPGGALTTRAIERFIERYGVNMAEAANPDPASYASFNDFFTRPLKEGARPLAPATWVCPVDGAISAFGAIVKDQVFQAKGHGYSTQALVGGDARMAAAYQDGHFATLYLSPKDYHRIHMPCAGTLKRMVWVPGSLYSVNPATARALPGLFARNERVVCEFDTSHGPFVLVLVGATIVGSMATTWHGVVNPPRYKTVKTWDYPGGDVRLAQGQEMGRFLLGSTVVMLWPAQSLQFNPDWAPARAIRLGQSMAQKA
jgi:phosphatidylserine decarboxylase